MKCRIVKSAEAFSAYAWRTPKQRVCEACTAKPPEQKECVKCGVMKSRDTFSAKAWRTPAQRVCSSCVNDNKVRWMCNHCKVQKSKAGFSMWLQERTSQQYQRTAWCNMCKVESQHAQTEMAQASAGAVCKNFTTHTKSP